MLVRRTALLAVAGLVLGGVAVAPAHADTASKRLPGTRTEILRGPSTPTTGKAALRAHDAVGGAPATTKYTNWVVTYGSGFTGHSDAKAAFQQAVDIWASIIHSNQTIRVSADLKDLGSGVLGSAGPDEFWTIGNVYYPDALYDALENTDKDPGNPDIDADFSSTEPDIYYGTDGNPPSGDIDFESVVLHELGHGLGFTGSADYTNGVGDYGGGHGLFIYDTFNSDASGNALSAKTGTALGTAFTSGAVYWNGAQGKAADGGTLPKLYAPSTWLDGTSMSHVDETTYPEGNVNSLMTPYLDNGEVVHRPGPVLLGMFDDLGWTTTLDVPGKVTDLSATVAGSQVELSWTKPAENGSAITGYTISYTDNGATQPALSSTTTSATIPGTTGHTYVVTVAASNVIGTGPSSDNATATSGVADTTPPTVTITGGPGTYDTTTSAAFTFTGTDNVGVTSYVCRLDSQAVTACSSGISYTGLSNASHTFRVASVDAAGNKSTAASRTFQVDTVNPTVTPNALPVFTLGATVGLRYAGTDASSGIASYDVRYRRAAFNGAFGALTYPSSWQGTTALVKTMTAAKGYTYCFSVRAHDKAGHVSAFSAEHCTATALDDRALAATSGWARGTASAYYASTDSSTRGKGQSLTRTSGQFRRLAVVAVTCNGCGEIGVYLNGTLIRSINLQASSTTYKRVVLVKDYGKVVAGTVVIKTLNTSRTYLDGLALSRT